MTVINTRAAVLALALAMPALVHAQRGMGPGRGAGNPVAPFIDMRRELNLSARQLVQLDSIERSLLQRNESVRTQVRARLDSMRPRRRATGEEEIRAFRAEGDSLRALRQVIVRNDSVARAAAMAVLTDSQRVRVRERMAERRGFEAGRQSMRGQRGMRQGRPGAGQRQGPPGRMGVQPREGMRGPGAMRGPGVGMRGPGRALRGPDGGTRGPDAFAPRFAPRRPPA